MSHLAKYLSPLMLLGLSASPAFADCAADTAVEPHDTLPAAAYHVALADDMNDADRSVGTTIDDSVITGKVKAALIGADDLDAMDVDVDTRSGVVTLTGTVRNDAEKQLAEELASDIKGVSSVDNQLNTSR